MEAEASEEKWWRPLLEFCIHVFVGTIIFLLIAAPAVGLDVLVSWLSGEEIGIWIIRGLKFAEYILFSVDLILLLVFVVRTAWLSGKKIWH